MLSAGFHENFGCDLDDVKTIISTNSIIYLRTMSQEYLNLFVIWATSDNKHSVDIDFLKVKNSNREKIGRFNIIYGNLISIECADKKTSHCRLVSILDKYYAPFDCTIINPTSMRITRRASPSFQVFYYADKHIFIASSNFKILLDILMKNSLELSIDNEAIISSIFLRHLPYGFTLIKEIKRVPPFYSLNISIKKKVKVSLEKRSRDILSFRLNRVVPVRISVEYFTKSLISAISSMIEASIRFHNKMEIPVLLSGGIDSSLLTVIIKEYVEKIAHKDADIVTFTVPLKKDRINARIVADQLGIDNRLISFPLTSKNLKRMFTNFVVNNGYPIFHSGFFQQAYRQLKYTIIFWNQGIEDLTLGRPEFRLFYYTQGVIGNIPKPITGVIMNIGVLSKIIKRNSKLFRVLAYLSTNPQKKIDSLFVSFKTFYPRNITWFDKFYRGRIFLSEELRNSNLSEIKKLSLLFLFNGFLNDGIYADKVLFSPAELIKFICTALRLPEKILIRGMYDRYVERVVLARKGIPSVIYMKKERDTWDEQNKEWIDKMKKYLEKKSLKLLTLNIVGSELSNYFLEDVSVGRNTRLMILLSSIYEILNYAKLV